MVKPTSSATFGVGLKLIRKMVEQQSSLDWYKAKLSKDIFKAGEVEVFEWVKDHADTYHQLPQLPTLEAQWSEITQIECPEPAAYYLDLIGKAVSVRHHQPVQHRKSVLVEGRQGRGRRCGRCNEKSIERHHPDKVSPAVDERGEGSAQAGADELSQHYRQGQQNRFWVGHPGQYVGRCHRGRFN